MELRKTHITTEEMFNDLIQTIKAKGGYPEHLDYAIPSEKVILESSEIVPKLNLDYGGNEGIYLDIALAVRDDWGRSDAEKIIRLGTCKTLDTSEAAMLDMSKMLGLFIVGIYDYARNNRCNLMRQGYVVSYKKASSNNPEVMNDYRVIYKNKDDVNQFIAKQEAEPDESKRAVEITCYDLNKRKYI